MGSIKFIKGIQSQYDALHSRDQDTLYYLTDANKIYLGDTLMSRGGS